MSLVSNLKTHKTSHKLIDMTTLLTTMNRYGRVFNHTSDKKDLFIRYLPFGYVSEGFYCASGRPPQLERLKGETLNQLFSVLEEWNRNLKGCFEESTAPVSLSKSSHEHSPDILDLNHD